MESVSVQFKISDEQFKMKVTIKLYSNELFLNFDIVKLMVKHFIFKELNNNVLRTISVKLFWSDNINIHNYLSCTMSLYVCSFYMK